MKYKIYIVEDDPGIAGAIAEKIGRWDMEAVLAQDFSRIPEEVKITSPHLILMDISLPNMNGYHWCREIRKTSRVPIIFISAASEKMNIVMAMDMGGDEFISKPFDGDVLIAKIRALLRRSYDYGDMTPALSCRGAFLNTDHASLQYRGDEIPLTKNEFLILQVLLSAKGKIVSREKLMDSLWKTDEFVDDNTLTVNVGRLRKKLDRAGLTGFIETKFGAGYRISEDEI